MSARKKRDDQRQFQVGDRVSVTLHTGLLVDATVRAMVENTDGTRLQVDYGKNPCSPLGLCVFFAHAQSPAAAQLQIN
jgi:hypothetical protein